MNDRTGLQDWISNSSRPSYGNQIRTERLSEHFWGAGQRSLFIKQLEDRNFKNHEIAYIRSKAQPKDKSIVEKILWGKKS
jgi:hypothetical protein